MTAPSHSIPGKAKYYFPIIEGDSEELKKFRQEWLKELQKRRNDSQATSSGMTVSVRVPPRNTEDTSITPRQGEVVPTAHTSLKEQINAGTPSTNHNVGNNEETFTPPSLRKALGIYHHAVEQEQTGNLNEALLLYRQAFRLVSHMLHRRVLMQA